MGILNRRITSAKTDIYLMVVAGGVCLSLALALRSVPLAIVGVLNATGALRLLKRTEGSSA